MSLDARMVSLIDALYDAALDGTHWPDALKQLADLTTSQAATLWVLDGSEQPRLPTFLYINLDPAFIKQYLDGVAPIDPTVQYLVRHPDRPIVHDGMVITEREKDHHPYYDWHHRFSDLRFRLVGKVCPAPAIQAGVALHRTRQIGRYEPQDIERFEMLYRHLERALSLGFRLGSLEAMQKCTTELLDRNPAALVLLDDRKQVVYTNAPAETLHSCRDGIKLSTSGIVLLRKQDNEKLQSFIADVISGRSHSNGSSEYVMSALRPSGKRPYVISVTPVSKQASSLCAFPPAVCIIITDPDVQTSLPCGRLQAAFGLTEAEAGLAVLLAAGDNLRSAGEKLGITYGTARTRLAEIFLKTETKRQGELILVLMRTLARI